MNALAEAMGRIESGIRERTERRVDEALTVARNAAVQAYALALRPTCGRLFEVVVADVMSEAEKSLRAKAIEQGERAELDAVLRRIGAESKELHA